ncbi:hypothetical protein HY489_00380 [Candidatus Woesearchaeota archaeon]|nr:hypothetical protein [Candidatus Woesearchaeota archaeon]
MSLEDNCNNCGSREIEETPRMRLRNFLAGMAIGAMPAIFFDYPGEYLAPPVLGMLTYMADLPFGPKISYECIQCNKEWQ